MNTTTIIRNTLVACFTAYLFSTGLISSAIAQTPPQSTETAAKEESDKKDVNEESLSLLKSPAATLRTFLSAMNESPPNYDRAIFCFTQGENQKNTASNEIRANRLRVGLEFLGYTAKENAGVPSEVKNDSTEWTLFPPPSNASNYVITQAKKISNVTSQELIIALTRTSTEDGAPWKFSTCLLYTSPSPRDQRGSRMPSSA